ncbi:Conserved putative membrane protein [Candidatus Protochlamydia naegleriophila]|uniref:Conserved putative membrane protein n=1 Tax=Candidatus Protochlamydia naegleriophila TaxID=389348 RepID=A0A0U5JD32_9BACT|nr:hypothetical protein [Candidatus Protochlamydia naegleriophila]CUI16546.1 Conserved putative membrane protein [Candidatus Protochlamydia naegleriophila]
MFKVSHTTLVVISGLIWLAVGCLLLPLGLNFIVESILKDNLTTMSRPLLDPLMSLTGGPDQAVLVLIAIALWVGFIKGRFVFAKTVQSSVDRIRSLPNPANISQIYTKKYYILLGSMILLGVLMRFTPIDVRGAVDVIIGSALIQGAMLYFRRAFSTRSQKAS